MVAVEYDYSRVYGTYSAYVAFTGMGDSRY